ncbi:MAG TPA: response regulator [Polyangia bacterium]|nr:response regulator [Polyangia bacterium]
MTAYQTKLRLSELRQTIGDAIRSQRLPAWLQLTAKGCYAELGHLVVTAVRPDDPAVIAAIARAETLLEVSGLAPSSQRPVAAHDGASPPLEPTLPRGSGRTIVLVEDDVDVRLSVREILEEEGYRVIALRDGMEALSVLEHVEPSMILIDLMMPRLNGWELVKRMSADTRWAAIPICIISAFANLRAPNRAVAALQKPLDLDHLLSTVATHAR